MSDKPGELTPAHMQLAVDRIKSRGLPQIAIDCETGEVFRMAETIAAMDAVIAAAEKWADGPKTSGDLHFALLQAVAKLREVRGK